MHGLGTSSEAEAKSYFRELGNTQVSYDATGDIDEVMKLAFDRKYADKRKEWLMNFDPTKTNDQASKKIKLEDFINNELICFSNHDNARSIPNIMDGLKPSQRKILFTCFKRNLKNEIKVAQLSGSVSELSAYHSGEASLQGAIIGMAYSFVGSNNIPLLKGNGQFGTRLQGGKDAASPRYIFTELGELTRTIFDPADDALLRYLDDDGFPIEPMYYAPILPMILVNGCTGIGTGFSSSIPCHDPLEIVEALEAILNDEIDDTRVLFPCYNGFKGTITEKDLGRSFISKGLYEIEGNTVTITELPLGRWTDDYKEFLENSLIDTTKNGGASNQFLTSSENLSGGSYVNFKVTYPSGALDVDKVETELKLTSMLTVSNMHLFSENGVIQKYGSAMEILKAFYPVRLAMYESRRQHLISMISRELEITENKKRFVDEIMGDELHVYKKTKREITDILDKKGYKRSSVNEMESGSTESTNGREASTSADNVGDFNYLTSMQISSFTTERLQELSRKIEDLKEKLSVLQGQTDKSIWRNDLQTFREKYNVYKQALISGMTDQKRKLSAVKSASKKGRVAKKQK